MNTPVAVSNIPVVAIDRSSSKTGGMMYVSDYNYDGTEMRVQVSSSKNHGLTWSAPVAVAPSSAKGDEFFQWVNVSSTGVVGVSNLIAIRSRVTTGDVKEHISKAFKRSAELEASGINVSVDGGKVSLSGKIHNWSDRRAAENAAWAMPSVTQVIDNLTVA